MENEATESGSEKRRDGKAEEELQIYKRKEVLKKDTT
jgi:hypothetical protein